MLVHACVDDSRVVLQPVQWQSLKRIEEIDSIGDKDYMVLEELRQVLLRHGYQDRFGVCLLHKHFDIEQHEVPLEETDEENRLSTIRVVPLAACPDAMETAWRFSEESGTTAGRRCEARCVSFGMTGHNPRHLCSAA
jgi:hypothetical protein